MSFKDFRLISLIAFSGYNVSANSMELRRRMAGVSNNGDQNYVLELRVLELRHLRQPQTFHDTLLESISDPELCMTCAGVVCLAACVPLIAIIARNGHLKQD